MDGAYYPLMREPHTDGRLASGMPNPPPWSHALEHDLPSSSSMIRQYQPYADRAPGTFMAQQDSQPRRAGYFGQGEGVSEFGFHNPKYEPSRPVVPPHYPPQGNTDTWKIKDPNPDRYGKLL